MEAQYTGGGYTAYQWFDMTVVRTPTLAALEVTVQGVAQSIGFAPERETYELSVTADELVITPTAFASGYTVTVNGQETPSGTAVTLPVNAEGAEIAVAVSSGGRSRTYTLTVQRVAAVDVTVRHDSDVTVHVFNSAHAEIGAAEQVDAKLSHRIYNGVCRTLCLRGNAHFLLQLIRFVDNAGRDVGSA